jgi:hypothetical protein
MSEISEKSKVSLDIKGLVGIIVAIISIAGIWFSLTAEISQLQIDVGRMEKTVDYNNNWIINFQPPKTVQETVEELKVIKIDNALLKHRVSELEEELSKIQ